MRSLAMLLVLVTVFGACTQNRSVWVRQPLGFSCFDECKRTHLGEDEVYACVKSCPGALTNQRSCGDAAGPRCVDKSEVNVIETVVVLVFLSPLVILGALVGILVMRGGAG